MMGFLVESSRISMWRKVPFSVFWWMSDWWTRINLADVKGWGVRVLCGGWPPKFVEQPAQWKNPSWLDYIGDDELPIHIGIIINHYKGTYQTTRVMGKFRLSWMHQVMQRVAEAWGKNFGGKLANSKARGISLQMMV